jgi:2-polyprenyl-6-methoxyphenol hydroxylase-like FAD-dependent oxidoreductase
MAIEDAITLSELLGEGAATEQVLHSYEAKRRPRTETIRALSGDVESLGGWKDLSRPTCSSNIRLCSQTPLKYMTTDRRSFRCCLDHRLIDRRRIMQSNPLRWDVAPRSAPN